MEDAADNTDKALDAIRNWQWLRCDPDGNPFHPAKDLSNVVSRLAMEGVPKPQFAVLKLLIRGDLVARGDYRWRKYEAGETFQFDGALTEIPLRQWQTLFAAIDDEWKHIVNNDFRHSEVNLQKLGFPECPCYEWEFRDNRFSLALCPPDKPVLHPDYFEEWFNAWDLDVWPRQIDDGSEFEQSEPDTQVKNTGGRPTAANWEAAALAMAGQYYRGEWKPKRIADVNKALADWLGDQKIYPSASTLQEHARTIFRAFESWEEG